MSNVSSTEIEEALRRVLGSYGLDHIELKSGLDHDGEAALFVTAVLPERTGPVPMPGDISASANVAVAEAMKRIGDERLSYLYIRRPDDERPEEGKIEGINGMMHDDLLEIAADLARREQAGRPRQASLRRAISTAYYALFHALAYLCANELVGWAKPWDVFSPIYRTLDHGRAKDAFKRISGQHGPAIATIGQTFILLQDRRHTADYDPSPFPFGRSETLDLIEQAKQAIARVLMLNDEQRLFVATQLIARARP